MHNNMCILQWLYAKLILDTIVSYHQLEPGPNIPG